MSGNREGETQVNRLSYAVAVPTLNAATGWDAFCAGLKKQTVALKHVLFLDSSSGDGTAELIANAGYELITIARDDFNHGGTRQLGVDRLCDVDIVVFLTQDVILLDPETLQRLVAPFEDASIGATYGRQLPRAGANPLEAHARLFNYPQQSHINEWKQGTSQGIKTAFLSNSCSAYRRAALVEIGGFDSNTIMAEDALAAGKLLKAGWKTAYVADAAVEHSHPYTILEEFSRYFDTGVYHRREAWLVESFGHVGSEGRRFLNSELRYLREHGIHFIPASLLHTLAKFAGYHLGRLERHLPASVSQRLSMQKNFWKKQG